MNLLRVHHSLFFFSSRRRHTRYWRDWSSDVCSSDLICWSQTATNIVTSKYFHGKPGTSERENSVRQLISRVANTIVRWGEEGGYFADAGSRDAFRDELTHLLVEQKMSFNSPVWFNVGVQPKPQCSACFINSVQDSMESIM